jgi:hypothetical protein
MTSAARSEPSLDLLRRADRLARAASGWLRIEQGPGASFPEPGPAHRDLLAGLVAGIGDRLAVDETVQLLAAYSLALLEYERDAAFDTPHRLGRCLPLSPDYVEGLRIADRLVTALGDKGAVL